MYGLSFESLAQMPPHMRMVAAPKVVAAVKERQRKDPTDLVVNGIPFFSEAEVMRFHQLVAAQEYGLVFDMRIHRRILLGGGYFSPSGEKHRPRFFAADFTYKLEDAPEAQVTVEIMAGRSIPKDIPQKLTEMGYLVQEV